MKKKSTEREHILMSGRRYDKVVLTEEEARAYGNKWKDFLGLRDWVLKLDIKREDNLMLSSVQGAVKGYTDKQVICLELLSPLDYGSALHPQNMEMTILHELAHIVLYPLNIKKKLSMEEERVVIRFSYALYEQSQGRFP